MILAHGAGNDMHNALISHVHERLAERGLMTVKFNFPYKEYGRNAPDRAPVLEETWHAVIAAVRNDPTLAPKSLFLAGKSMGGRIASQLVGQGEDCTGLVCLGYPLHPPNKRDTLCTSHWPQIHCPMLFIEGTRDTLCDITLLNAEFDRIEGQATLHLIEGGDHSFKVLKRLGRSEQSVWDEFVEVMVKWFEELGA